jgi:RNA polymerase sigma factor (sigma-70 family)
MQSEQEAYWIQKVIDGDAAAFAHLVQQYKDLVYTIAFRITKNAEDAEEVAQDSFLKAFRYLKSFRQESKFSTWLFRIVHNTAISKQRKLKIDYASTDDRAVLNIGADELENGFHSFNFMQRRHYLRLAMEQLSGEEANLVGLFYYNELSMAEIQEVTGMEISNIKVKLHRVRKKMHDILRSLLKDELEEIR